MKYCPLCLKEFSDDVKICSADGTELLGQVSYLSQDPSAMIGNILDKRYKIESIIGTGGMGSVLKAKHIYLDRDAAIKVVRPDLLLIPEIKKRFLREARAISLVAHKNIVGILDFGVSETGVYYLVMEYLKGKDLYQYIGETGEISLDEVLRISIQILRALVEIHAQGFVHRDLKPENILLVEKDGQKNFVKILDFGIAAIFEGHETVEKGQERLTRSGGTLGSPYYMSPEQVLGESVDPRSDIYAMGCLMYEMFTGQPPFTGKNTVEIMHHQTATVPVKPSEKNKDIPDTFDQIIMRCLEKDKEKRYQSADKVLIEISNFSKNTTSPYVHTAMVTFPRVKKISTAETNADIQVINSIKKQKSGKKLIAFVSVAAILAIFLVSYGIYKFSASSNNIATELSIDNQVSVKPVLKQEPDINNNSAPIPASAPSDNPVVVAAAAVPVPEKITITFDSTPPLVKIYQGNEIKGETPFSMTQNKEDAKIEYVFRKQGYHDENVEVSLDKSQVIKVTLLAVKERLKKHKSTKVQKPKETNKQKKKKSVKVEVPKDFIDPFGD